MVNYMIRNPEGITVDNVRYEFNQVLSDLTPETINAMLAVGTILILEPVTVISEPSNESFDMAGFSGLTNS